MKKIILLLLLFTFSLQLNAQSTNSTISGSVTELKSGEVVISLTVALYTENSTKPFRGAYTNKFGLYSITNLPPGNYKLVATGVGYQSFTKNIELKPSQNLKLNIELETVDVKGQEIVVESDRLDEEAVNRISTMTISPSFISKMPSIGGEVDVFRTLQLLPGIKQATELSSGLYVRGGSPDQNLNLLDGVIVYNPTHLGGFLSVFNADALRDIKLIKGAFPAEYGGRLSSVLDMTMKEGTKEKFSGSGGVSLISSRLTLEGPIDENSTFMISGRRMYLDLIVNMSAEDPDEVPTYYFYDLNAKVNYKLGENDRLFLSGFLCDDVLKAPEETDFEFDISWGNKTANMRWMHIISPKLFTNFSLIYTDYSFGTFLSEKNEDTKTNFETKSQIQDYMLRGEAQYFPDENHKIKAGAEAILHNFLSHAEFNNEIEDSPFLERDITSVEAAIYAQDEWQISDLLSSNIGLRGYYFQEADYFAIEPRLSASYRLTENSSISASAALAHQFLHLIVRNDITLPTDLWFPSTSIITPSKSWQGVLGYEHIFNDGEYLVSGEIYYKDMQNLYEYKDSASFTLGIPLEEQFTQGRGVAYGAELFINKRIGSITGWLGYTLSWTQRQFDDLNNGKWFYPRYDRRHDISLVFTYELGKRWELGASWVYGTGQAYTMPTGTYAFDMDENGYSWEKYQYTDRNGARLPSFHKLDLNFMYKYTWFNIPWQLSLNIYNAYNQKNPFAWYISEDWNSNDNTSKKVIKQITLFPMIPTFGVSFKF